MWGREMVNEIMSALNFVDHARRKQWLLEAVKVWIFSCNATLAANARGCVDFTGR
jgi:hypothetical protein